MFPARYIRLVSLLMGLLLGLGGPDLVQAQPAPDGGGLFVPPDVTFDVVLFEGQERGDDGSSVAVSLPFPFEFYGQQRQTLYVNLNGNLTFDGPESSFTPDNFPLEGPEMIAPFFADVDTRNPASGLVYQRVDANDNRIIITWSEVGYFAERADKRNTFQVLLSDGNDPLMGTGNNVCFAYGAMEWTTGSSAGGVGGFGGTPATVGINAGDGLTHSQVGRFDRPGTDYDGPVGRADGVEYLSDQRICFDASTANTPPIALDLPAGNTYFVEAGTVLRDTILFIGPEDVDVVTASVVATAIDNFSSSVTTAADGHSASVALEFAPTTVQIGESYNVRLEAVDDFEEVPGETTVDLTMTVLPPGLQAIAAPPTDLTPTSAVLRGRVVPEGGKTTVTFELFEDDAQTRRTLRADESPLPAGPDTVSVQAAASALRPGTAYSYRIVATNATAQAASDDELFSTPVGVPTFTPSALAFDTEQVGRTSAARTLAFQNLGAEPLSISMVEIGASDVFTIGTDTGEPVLEPGETRTFTIAFSPRDETETTTSLRVTTTEGVFTAPLSGTGADVAVEALPDVRVGSPVTIRIDVPEGFAPQTRELCYRVGGAPAFTCAPMADEPSTGFGNRLRGEIPAGVTTVRGVEYFVRLVERRPDSTERVFTVPREGPETRLAQVPVRFDALPAEGPFAPETYRMISVPVTVDSATVDGVLADDFGPYDDRSWRLVAWNPLTDRYEELTDGTTPLRSGRSYWLISRTGTGFDVGAGTSTSLEAPFALTLSPGWHQISSPFAFPVAWRSVEGTTGVDGPFAYDGEGFRAADTLPAWDGVFVLNTGTDPVTITIPPIDAASAPLAAQTRASRTSQPSPFTVRIEAALPDGRRDARNAIGLRPGAAPGIDGFDVSEPPPVGPHVRLSVLEGSRRLAQSVKPSGTDGQVWTLELTTSETRANAVPVTLMLRPSAAPAANGFSMYLLDAETRALVPILGSRAEVTLEKGDAPRRLRLIVGTEAFARAESGGAPLVPARTALLPSYPNPMGPQATLPYTLAEPGSVRIVIYDLLGRSVRRLVAAEQAAGTYLPTWDGRNDFGQPVASGLYFCRMVAGSHVQTHKLVVIR